MGSWLWVLPTIAVVAAGVGSLLYLSARTDTALVVARTDEPRVRRAQHAGGSD